MGESGQIRGSLKGKEIVVKFPMTIGTQGRKIIQGVYNGHRRVVWKFLDWPYVTDLEVRGVTTDNAALWLTRIVVCSPCKFSNPGICLVASA